MQDEGQALPLPPDGAAIVLMASIVGSKGSNSSSVYNATKAAIRSLARPLTSGLKGRRIRINAMSPGPIKIPGLNDLVSLIGQAEQLKAQMVSVVPLGRMNEADEIAKAVVFLASDDSRYMNIVELLVGGGMAQAQLLPFLSTNLAGG